MAITTGKVTIGTQADQVVLAGPYNAETGLVQIGLLTKTSASGIVDETSCTVQVSNSLTGNDFAVLGTTPISITPDFNANGVITGGRTQYVTCKRWRIVAGGAFTSGTAVLYIHGIDVKIGGTQMNISSGGPITIGTQSANTVVAGPYNSLSGLVWIGVSTISGGAGIGTPTAYTIQCSMDDTDNAWGTLPTTSVTITASTSANAVVQAGRTSPVQCRRWRVVSGAAFGSGTAQLYVHGTDVQTAMF